MKKVLSILLCAVLILSVGVIGASAVKVVPNSASVYVTIADSEGRTAVTVQKILVTDTDEDGVLTINDALYIAHEEFYDGGAAQGYDTSVTEYGLGVTKLWGSTCGSYGYYVNNQSAWSLADPVTEGDYLVAFVYTDLVAWSDHYSFFDQNVYRAAVGKEISVTYYEAGYDNDWNPVNFPVVSGKLYLNGEPTDVETNADGQAKLTFSEPGTYQLSAVTENKRLVTPYSYIEITADDTLIGDADRSGDLTILDATHIQRWLAVLVDDEEIDLEAADADRSGDVTILDATAIQRWLAGIIPAL